MNYTYFLSANSAKGFYSIYDSFPPDKDDFLHIIKGGPGCGKSGFMKKIGKAASEKGLSVHYIICSGDPDSLDGIYIPALKEAWVDGTNPHVREPGIFGVNSDYVNLTSFFKGKLSGSDKYYVNSYTRSYKAKYQSAYVLLSAASSMSKAIYSPLGTGELSIDAEALFVDILSECPISSIFTGPKVSRRFLSCIGCRGYYRLYQELNKLCKFNYVVSSGLHPPHEFLGQIASLAEKAGEALILCPSPLEPDRLSAVLLPERNLSFCSEGWNIKDCRHIDLDVLSGEKVSEDIKSEILYSSRIRSEILELSYRHLADAKKYHDLLEQQYHPYIDFDALSDFTDSVIKDIFN